MIAKVIETGEIIEVKRLRPGTYLRLLEDGETVVEYDEDELDFGEKYSGPLICGKILNIRRKSYKQGKDDLLNKAVEWLKENLAKETTILACGSVTINFNNVIEKFKKAMED